MITFFEIFPRAIKMPRNIPAVTERSVSSIVILAPISRAGIHEIIRSITD
jgi:hypothetical protein